MLAQRATVSGRAPCVRLAGRRDRVNWLLHSFCQLWASPLQAQANLAEKTLVGYMNLQLPCTSYVSWQ